MQAVDSFRYSVVRAICCPMGLLPKSTPLIGGKTAIELLISLAICVIIAVMIASLGSTAVGRLAEYVGVVVILFSLRKVAILSALGISFERGLFWHKVLACCYLAAMLIHGLTIGETNSTGLILGVVSGALSLVYLLAYFNISFNAFYYVHVAGYIVIAPVTIMHGAPIFGFVAIIWGADLLVRYLLQGVKAQATVSQFSSEIVKLSVPNTFKGAFEPGQYFFLMVPSLNVYEYHPFSIASAPNDEELLFYVKALGDWTDKLRALAAAADGGKAGGESGATSSAAVYLEGPYGKLSLDAFNGAVYPATILVSGGVGVTPMMSSLAHLVHLAAAGKIEGMKKIVFVWTVRDKAFASKLTAEFFQPLIDKHMEKTSDACVFTMKDVSFEFHLHMTNNAGGNSESGKVLCVSDNVELATLSKGESPAKSFWSSGRPNLSKIFAETAQAVPAESKGCLGGRVSVCVCGPKVMVDAVRGLQISASSATKTTFDLHEELFNF